MNAQAACTCGPCKLHQHGSAGKIAAWDNAKRHRQSLDLKPTPAIGEKVTGMIIAPRYPAGTCLNCAHIVNIETGTGHAPSCRQAQHAVSARQEQGS